MHGRSSYHYSERMGSVRREVSVRRLPDADSGIAARRIKPSSLRNASPDRNVPASAEIKGENREAGPMVGLNLLKPKRVKRHHPYCILATATIKGFKAGEVLRDATCGGYVCSVCYANVSIGNLTVHRCRKPVNEGKS